MQQAVMVLLYDISRLDPSSEFHIMKIYVCRRLSNNYTRRKIHQIQYIKRHTLHFNNVARISVFAIVKNLISLTPT